MMAVIGQESVPVASWCMLCFFWLLLWLRMLSVAEVHFACSVAVGKVCGSCLVLLQRAMSYIVYCRVLRFSDGGCVREMMNVFEIHF